MFSVSLETDFIPTPLSRKETTTVSRETFRITSPVMGTFYRSPSPDIAPFVEVGKKIAAGDVVCVIESMKIFTEIRSEKAGTITEILVENEDAVMKNQELIEKELRTTHQLWQGK